MKDKDRAKILSLDYHSTQFSINKNWRKRKLMWRNVRKKVRRVPEKKRSYVIFQRDCVSPKRKQKVFILVLSKRHLSCEKMFLSDWWLESYNIPNSIQNSWSQKSPFDNPLGLPWCYSDVQEVSFGSYPSIYVCMSKISKLVSKHVK